jgi:hypothetical protein
MNSRATFVSEPLEPLGDTFQAAAMAAGGPGLPAQFKWRGQERQVARVLDTWRTTDSCRYGAAEQYVRKHWFRIVTADGAEMEIYFDRQPRRGQSPKRRWWIATVK